MSCTTSDLARGISPQLRIPTLREDIPTGSLARPTEPEGQPLSPALLKLVLPRAPSSPTDKERTEVAGRVHGVRCMAFVWRILEV